MPIKISIRFTDDLSDVVITDVSPSGRATSQKDYKKGSKVDLTVNDQGGIATISLTGDHKTSGHFSPTLKMGRGDHDYP